MLMERLERVVAKNKKDLDDERSKPPPAEYIPPPAVARPAPLPRADPRERIEPDAVSYGGTSNVVHAAPKQYAGFKSKPVKVWDRSIVMGARGGDEDMLQKCAACVISLMKNNV